MNEGEALASRMLTPRFGIDKALAGMRLLWFEEYGAQRRQRDPQRIWPPVPTGLLCLGAGMITNIASTVVFRVAVEDLLVPAFHRDADGTIRSYHRREVETRDKKIVGAFGATQVANRAMFAVIAINPLESWLVEIEFM